MNWCHLNFGLDSRLAPALAAGPRQLHGPEPSGEVEAEQPRGQAVQAVRTGQPVDRGNLFKAAFFLSRKYTFTANECSSSSSEYAIWNKLHQVAYL